MTRRGSGPLMHFDGRKFTNNDGPKVFSFARGSKQARKILKRYAILSEQGYHVWLKRYEPRRSNPESLESPGIEEAARKFEDFTGHTADKIIKASQPKVKEGLVIGELDLIGYRVKRDGVENGKLVRYAHRFRKSSRPLLAVNKDGNQLLIVGGRYEFTEAGIEDR